MASLHWITWVEAGLAGLAGVLGWLWVRRLSVSYLRDYLADLAWLPAVLLAFMAALGEHPATALMVTVVIAPVAALRNVLFAIAFRNPPNDPSAVDEGVRQERDALRAQLLHSNSSEATPDPSAKA